MLSYGRACCATAIVAGCVTATMSVAPAAWGAAPVELRLSTALGTAYAQGRAGAAWASLIRERSAGRLAIKHSPGATLAGRDSAREFAALRDGAIDLAVGAASMWSAQVPQLNLFALPWFVPDRAALEALLRSDDIVSRLTRQLDAAGVTAIAWCADDFIELATKSPVHGPSDVAGLNIRSRASPVTIDTLVGLGARPSSLSFTDARAAMAAGTLDGEATTVQAYVAAQSSAAGLNHLLLWDAQADVLVFAVNRNLWQGWSDADRELVRAAAQETAHTACPAAQGGVSDAVLAALSREGTVVTRLTAAGKAAFRSSTRGVFDKWGSVVGMDLIDAAEAAMHAPAAVGK